MPTALASHKRACTEEKPMLKQKAGYTSQMKARVKYPKLKSKSEKKTSEVKIMSSTQVEEITSDVIDANKDDDVSSDDSATVEEIQTIILMKEKNTLLRKK